MPAPLRLHLEVQHRCCCAAVMLLLPQMRHCDRSAISISSAINGPPYNSPQGRTQISNTVSRGPVPPKRNRHFDGRAARRETSLSHRCRFPLGLDVKRNA
jgi:hypothetical protein